MNENNLNKYVLKPLSKEEQLIINGGNLWDDIVSTAKTVSICANAVVYVFKKSNENLVNAFENGFSAGVNQALK
jgi:hypothetical protein